MTRPVRIADCSGSRGDRLSAAREMRDLRAARDPVGVERRRAEPGRSGRPVAGGWGATTNVGVRARDDAAHAWLRAHLTEGTVRDLLGPEATELVV